MTDQAGLGLSVRGEATSTVPADSALLSGRIAVSRGSKPDALAEASAASHRLTTDLTSMGAGLLDPRWTQNPKSSLPRSMPGYAPPQCP